MRTVLAVGLRSLRSLRPLGWVGAAFVVACGGGRAEGERAVSAASVPADAPAEPALPPLPCGDASALYTHDLGAGVVTEASAPCSASGARDYSAVVRVETIEQGVHIVIDATDDEVTLLGPAAKERDLVMVYPRGKGSPGVEVALAKTKTGYRGDKIVFWDDLGALSDEGTKIDVAIFDHDKSAKSTEEMHVALAVSSGKSCERAQDEYMQRIDMRGGGRAPADLTNEQLGAPMRTSAFFGRCGLPETANADLCVAVKNGRPVGVSVTVMPANRQIAACIDRSARRLAFPSSDKLDVVHQKF
jgi:hypothetical protein